MPDVTDGWGVFHHRTPIMKTKLLFLPALFACLSLSSCVSLALQARKEIGGHKPSVIERVGCGAIDAVTLPVQLPVLIQMQSAD